MQRKRGLLLAAILVVATAVIIAVASVSSGSPEPGHTREAGPLVKWLGTALVLLPPLWFLVEWHTYTGASEGPEFEAFKLSQERARDIWLAIIGILVIWFGLKGG